MNQPAKTWRSIVGATALGVVMLFSNSVAGQTQRTFLGGPVEPNGDAPRPIQSAIEVKQLPLPSPEFSRAEPIPAPSRTVAIPTFESVAPPMPEGPLGFAGKSRVPKREQQTNEHFVPIEDRWRIAFPTWDRYGRGGQRRGEDARYQVGNPWNPFEQNVLKADYPLFRQDIFLDVTASTQALYEPRMSPTGTTPFESTVNPNQRDFFGSPNQQFYTQNLLLSLDMFKGDAAFRPVDWRVKITGIFNINNLTVNELAVVNPDVTKGTDRIRTFLALQEWFVEKKLADIGPDYDFVSVRIGSQPFTSDFRGFIFSDVNRGVRLFGNRNANRDQYNLVYFLPQEKDTNSGLNTFNSRNQHIIMANFYRQDFIFPGYTSQWSMHFNHDSPTFRFDRNGFLVRPDPVGVFQPHSLNVVYLGWTGDGHINHLNINHAFYWALGRDSHNPLANQQQRINAQMAALELSYDQDWIRFRTSFFWSSGDKDINNRNATGFDSILDNPNFAGGEFSFWQRQQLRLFGVNLNQRMSLVPDLRSSKLQGQSNFVNPGLFLGNFGIDFELTPKLRSINNANVLWFDSVNPLQQFVYQQHIKNFIGVDLSTGMEYRPYLNNNVILKGGVSTLLPGQGFRDLYSRFNGGTDVLFAGFLEAVLTY